MTFDFTGLNVLVASGSRGIGRAIALGFVRGGARVSACARGTEGLAALAREGVAHVRATDLADTTEVTAWVEEAAAALDGIDVLVNNASGFGAPDTEEAWKRGQDIHVGDRGQPRVERDIDLRQEEIHRNLSTDRREHDAPSWPGIRDASWFTGMTAGPVGTTAQ